MTPNPLDLDDVTHYVENHIGSFHEKRLQKLGDLKLDILLARKNPYLFKARNFVTAEGLVRSLLDAYLSSQEETLFGDFLEGVAIFVCAQVRGGYKPPHLEGIDLIFAQRKRVYLIQIKSGPHWGNSDQIKKMLTNFDNAKAALQADYPDAELIAINGCAYGVETQPIKRKGAYLKLCGQDFWRLIANSDDFYLKIIEPLGHRAKQRNDDFSEAYGRIVNRCTAEFITTYCFADGAINWEHLVKRVSARRSDRYPLE